MMSLNPLLLVGGVIGTVSVLLLIAYACVKDKKTAMGFERSMADGEILRRLFGLRQTLTLRQFRRRGLSRPLLHLLRHRVAPHRGLHRRACGGRFRTEKPLCQCGRIRGCAGLLDGQHLLQAVILQRCGPAHHLRFA